jgi:hypothetical protein
VHICQAAAIPSWITINTTPYQQLTAAAAWLPCHHVGATAYEMLPTSAACRDAAIRRSALFELQKGPAADTLLLQVSEQQPPNAVACLDGVWISTHKSCAELQQYNLPGEVPSQQHGAALYHQRQQQLQQYDLPYTMPLL